MHGMSTAFSILNYVYTCVLLATMQMVVKARETTRKLQARRFAMKRSSACNRDLHRIHPSIFSCRLINLDDVCMRTCTVALPPLRVAPLNSQSKRSKRSVCRVCRIRGVRGVFVVFAVSICLPACVCVCMRARLTCVSKMMFMKSNAEGFWRMNMGIMDRWHLYLGVASEWYLGLWV